MSFYLIINIFKFQQLISILVLLKIKKGVYKIGGFLDVSNALGATCKKLRAYSYITPRDANGMIFEDPEDVVNFQNMLAFREIELIWPEGTSGNVFLGKDEESSIALEPTRIAIQ